MSFLKLASFMPDADPSQPGVITDCTNLLPTLKGVRSGPSPLNTAHPALAAACRGTFIARTLDGSRRYMASTQTALYEAASTSWTDRTRTVGGAYTGSAASVWRFSQYGDATIAVNKIDTSQVSTSGAFADLTAMPKCLITEAVDLFVFAFNTNEGTYGDSPDRWWCCKKGDHTNWTPAIADECVTGRLLGSPGPILGGKRLGSGIAVYKQESLYLGSYIGPPQVWDWRLIASDIGALSHEAIASVTIQGTPAHIFVANDDIYVFDGTRPVAIGSPVREWFFANLHQTYKGKTILTADSARSLVRIYYPNTTSTGNLNACLIYNYKSHTWGRGLAQEIEWADQYSPSGINWDDLGTYYSTWDGLPNASWDAAFQTAGGTVPAIFNASHRLQTLTGAAGSSMLTTGDFGKDDAVSFLSRVRPRLLTAAPSGAMTNYFRDALQEGLTADAAAGIQAGRFDVLRSARWHRLRFDLAGDYDLLGLDIDLAEDSAE